jgi:hypothetical protein
MSELDRRAFLARSSLLAAAAGAVAAVPGVLGVLASEAPELDAAAGDSAAADSDVLGATAADASQPLVAHVRDMATGEIGIFNGTNEVVVTNPALARSILRAAG